MEVDCSKKNLPGKVIAQGGKEIGNDKKKLLKS